MPPFRNLHQALAHQFMGRDPYDVGAFVFNAAAFGFDQPGNGMQGGGFTGPVGTDQGDDFPVPHFHVQILDGVDGPIVYVQIFD